MNEDELPTFESIVSMAQDVRRLQRLPEDTPIEMTVPRDSEAAELLWSMAEGLAAENIFVMRPCYQVPCVSFGDEDPIPKDPLFRVREEDPDWWTEVTEGWKKHPFLRGVEDGPQGT